MTPTDKLRLSVRDEEDLIVMSSLLQDSLIALAEVKYLSEDKRFVFVANRFLWEREDQEALEVDEVEHFSRVLCGVCFENVTGVKQKGLNRNRKGQIVSLLSVSKLENSRIQLNFSANVSIRLDVSDLFCHFQDIDSPWPTEVKPEHQKTNLLE
jgi:hypothetical protein